MGCDERYRGYSCFVWFLRLAILGTVFLVTLQGVTAEEPTETQCRPYIEKALKEHHIDETKVSEEKSTEQDSPPTDELTASTPEESGEATKGDDDSNSNEETEEDTQERTKRSLDENTKEDEDESVEGDTKEETKEEVSGEGDTKEENENGADKETQEEADSVEGDTVEENQENEETKEEDSNETDESTEGDSEENDGGENASTEDAAKEDNDEDSKENNTDDKQDTVEDDQGPVEGNTEENQESVEGDTKEDQDSIEGDTKEDQDSVEGDTKEDQDSVQGDTKEDQDSVEGDTKEDQDSVEGDTKEDQDSVEGDTKEDQDSVEKDTKEDQGSIEGDTQEDQESVEGDTREDKESVEGDTREDKESVEGDTREDQKSVEGDTKEDQDSKEGDTKEESSIEGDTKEDQDSVEGDTKEAGSAEADTKEETSIEGDTKEKESVEGDTVEEVSMEGDTKEDQTEEGDDSVESATKETEEKSGEDSSEASAPEEEELTKESIIPENLRARDHITQILKLEEDSDLEVLLTKAIDNTLKSLKNIYDSAIKPLELLYKYRDLSNRHYGDPEIFSKPLVLFMGPWSGGKSSTINYLVDNEFTPTALRTGAEPSPAYFNILMHGEEEEILDGTQLAADWTFSGLQKFGQGLLDRLRGVKLPRKILEKVNIVEIPGILEIRKQVQRLFPFNDACQWFIDRADIIFLVYDPAKLDVGPETEAILDQLKGREYQTRIVLNKADTVKPEELMRVQGTLIWNISPLMSSQEPPVMYSVSLWSLPYESGAPTRLLLAQERALLKDLREAIDKRIENKISSARRFAVRVRNHAKMVDCYLTTYYNHKSFFGNKKRISDDIIENPQKYHIYEGLSTLTNISRYDLPDPEMYRDFFKLNPLYDFTKLSDTCTYFRGCPINKLDVAIAYDLPELVGKYKKAVEQAREQIKKTNS